MTFRWKEDVLIKKFIALFKDWDFKYSRPQSTFFRFSPNLFSYLQPILKFRLYLRLEKKLNIKGVLESLNKWKICYEIAHNVYKQKEYMCTEQYKFVDLYHL